MSFALFKLFFFYFTTATITTTTTIVSAGFLDKRHVHIHSFKYQPCDSMRNTGAWVKDADIMTTSYGDLDVLGTIVTAVNLTSPIKASVNLRRNVLGLYMPLPCIKNFGSCEYPDLCVYGYTNNENCPALLDEHDIPCRCPITAGTYNFPGGQFEVPKTRWASILAGKYKGTVKFYSKNQLIACYKFFYSLE